MNSKSILNGVVTSLCTAIILFFLYAGYESFVNRVAKDITSNVSITEQPKQTSEPSGKQSGHSNDTVFHIHEYKIPEDYEAKGIYQ